MPGLNKVQLIGHLGKDPETRQLPKGGTVCSFTIAVNRSWRGADGKTKEATDWFNVDAWGKLGEICQKFLNKGRLVYIEGRLQTDRVETEDQVRYFTRVIANDMQMLERKQEEPTVEP